jgi:hypothetical protein
LGCCSRNGILMKVQLHFVAAIGERRSIMNNSH